MRCIILIDNGKQVFGLENEIDDIHIFESEEQAMECADGHPLCQNFNYLVINLDKKEII